VHVSFEVDFRQHTDALRICRAMGYDAFAIVDQQTVPQQEPPYPAREGTFTPYRFKVGCTGLFGAELPVGWNDVSTTARTCKRILRRRRTGRLLRGATAFLGAKETGERLAERFLRDVATWYDMHATRAPA
jgi:hypothetical protein